MTCFQTPCMPGTTAPTLLLHNYSITVQIQPHTNKQQTELRQGPVYGLNSLKNKDTY